MVLQYPRDLDRGTGNCSTDILAGGAPQASRVRCDQCASDRPGHERDLVATQHASGLHARHVQSQQEDGVLLRRFLHRGEDAGPGARERIAAILLPRPPEPNDRRVSSAIRHHRLDIGRHDFVDECQRQQDVAAVREGGREHAHQGRRFQDQQNQSEGPMCCGNRPDHQHWIADPEQQLQGQDLG